MTNVQAVTRAQITGSAEGARCPSQMYRVGTLRLKCRALNSQTPTSPEASSPQKGSIESMLGNTFINPPYHYEGSEVISIVFRTDPDLIAAALPPVLKPVDNSGLMSVRIVHPRRSSFGPYIGTYLGAPALLDGQTVSHCLSGMKTTFSGAVAGREVWGMPLQLGEASWTWDGEVLNVVSGRNGVDFVRTSVRLERRVEPPTGGAMLTYATQRLLFDKDPTENVLIGLRGEVEDPSAITHWMASSTLGLVGGDPLDDWSMFPVHEVIETRFRTGGRSVLNRGVIVAEW